MNLRGFGEIKKDKNHITRNFEVNAIVINIILKRDMYNSTPLAKLNCVPNVDLLPIIVLSLATN